MLDREDVELRFESMELRGRMASSEDCGREETDVEMSEGTFCSTGCWKFEDDGRDRGVVLDLSATEWSILGCGSGDLPPS